MYEVVIQDTALSLDFISWLITEHSIASIGLVIVVLWGCLLAIISAGGSR